MSEPKTKCTDCGTSILQRTADKNHGVCMLCKKGAVTCSICGLRTASPIRGPDSNDMCMMCYGEMKRQEPTQIDSFIRDHGAGQCSVLRQLFRFDQGLRQNREKGWIGIDLIDPPRCYAECGTVLCNPLTTPVNTIAFANTLGDDVHFGLVGCHGGYSDASAVVMTVPMGGGADDGNVVVGATLHEFLCLGCQHGFFELEQIVYDRDETIHKLSSPPQNLEREDEVLLARFRVEFDLRPWADVGRRLQQLEGIHKNTLEFHL